jgi:hypothetical protein
MSDCKHYNRAILTSVCEDGLFVIKKKKSMSGPSCFLLEVCVSCSTISPEATVFVEKESVSPKSQSGHYLPFGPAGTAILLNNPNVTFHYDENRQAYYAYLPNNGLENRVVEHAFINVPFRTKTPINQRVSTLDVLRDSRFPKNEKDQIEMLRMSEEARIELEKKVQRIRDKQNERNRRRRENGSSEKKRKIDDTTDNCFSDISDKENEDQPAGCSEEEEEGIIMPKEEDEN